MICDHGAMVTSIRVVLTALLLSSVWVVLTQQPAAACKCSSDGVRAEAQRADVVFSGVLVKQRAGRQLGTYTFDVERIYQGRVDDTPVAVVSSARTTCGLGRLKVDRAYVVFATSAARRLKSSQCTGTGRASPAYVADVERVLGPGNAIPKPPPPGQEPAEPEYTRVDGADSPEFTRLAAPGGAMVLVGLLGLILFRKRS